MGEGIDTKLNKSPKGTLQVVIAAYAASQLVHSMHGCEGVIHGTNYETETPKKILG